MTEVDNVKYRINEKIEIIESDGDYKSNIEDVGDNYIEISIPIKEGKYMTLRQGERVEVIYYHNRRIYKFISVVIGRKIDRVPLLILAKPKKLIEVQRRTFVRISCVENIKYSKIETNVETKGIMLDISAGGLKLRTAEHLKIREKIQLKILINKEEIGVKGEIVRVIEEQDKKYACGVRFVDLEDKISEKIVRYVFQLMREKRKNGLEED